MASPSSWLRNADGSEVTVAQLTAEVNAICNGLTRNGVTQTFECRNILQAGRDLISDIQTSSDIDLCLTQRRLLKLHSIFNSLLCNSGFKMQKFVSLLPAHSMSGSPKLRHPRIDLPDKTSGAHQSRVDTEHRNMPGTSVLSSFVVTPNKFCVEVRHDGARPVQRALPVVTYDRAAGARYYMENLVPSGSSNQKVYPGFFIRTESAAAVHENGLRDTGCPPTSPLPPAQPQKSTSTAHIASPSGPLPAPATEPQPAPPTPSFRNALPAARMKIPAVPNKFTKDPTTWIPHAVVALLRNSDWPAIKALMCTSKAMYELCRKIVKYVLVPKQHLLGSTLKNKGFGGTNEWAQKQQPRVVERVATVQPHASCCRCSKFNCTTCQKRESSRQLACKSNCDSSNPRCEPCKFHNLQIKETACEHCRNSGFIDCPTERGVFPPVLPAGHGLVVIILDKAVFSKGSNVVVDPGVLLLLWWTVYCWFKHAQSIEIRNSALVSTAILMKTHFKGFDELKVLRFRGNPLMHYNKLGIISNDGSQTVWHLLNNPDITFDIDIDYVGYDQHPNHLTALSYKCSAIGVLQKIMGTAIANGKVPIYINDQTKEDPRNRIISKPENLHPLHSFTMKCTGMSSEDAERHLRRLVSANWTGLGHHQPGQDAFELLIRDSPAVLQRYPTGIPKKGQDHGAIKKQECETCFETFYGIGMINRVCCPCKELELCSDLFDDKNRMWGQPSSLVDDQIQLVGKEGMVLDFKTFLAKLADSKAMDNATNAREDVTENLEYLQ